MEDLIKKIEQWASDRNIIKGSKPIDQAMKLFSEFGELADNVGKGRDCRDDIGDVLTVLIIMSKQFGLSVIRAIDLSDIPEKQLSKHIIIDLMRDLNNFTRSGNQYNLNLSINSLVKICLNTNCILTECLEIAYNDIKDRKGVMSNGVFIKESDPAYAEVIKSIEDNC